MRRNARSISSSSKRGASRRFLRHHVTAASNSRVARGVKRTAGTLGPEPPGMGYLSLADGAGARFWRGHRLRDLPHLREHSIGRNQLPLLDRAIGIRDRVVELGQFLGRELDLVLAEAVDQTLNQLGALVGRHLEHHLEHGFDGHL